MISSIAYGIWLSKSMAIQHIILLKVERTVSQFAIVVTMTVKIKIKITFALFQQVLTFWSSESHKMPEKRAQNLNFNLLIVTIKSLLCAQKPGLRISVSFFFISECSVNVD